MSAEDFDFCDAVIYNQSEKIAERSNSRHIKKYKKLEAKVSNTKILCNGDTVKNLSSKELDESSISVLAKGMNFAPTPLNIPTESIIGSVEECLRRNKIDRLTSETIRQDVSVLIRKAKPIKSNITKKEMNSLKKLSADKDIIILPADKGNCTVVLDTDDYHSKITNLLNDSSTYKQVSYDPTARVLRKVRQKLAEYGVAMGSPVAPIIADIWMQYFEMKALETSPIKPVIWKRYVDDTFCILNKNDVDTFLNHLNSVHSKIQFTMEIEENNTLAFLDVKVIKNQDGTLGHTVYRKNTHTDRYLHAASHHHPANFNSVVSALINRAHAICDQNHLQDELERVDAALIKNGYSLKQRSWKPKTKPTQDIQNENEKRAFLPYRKGVSEGIGRILSNYGIKSIFKPPAKIRQILRSPKDKIPLQNPGVYSVPCSCGSEYIGETKRSISTRLNEHIKAIQKNEVTKSAICEHLAYNTDHFIRFDQAKSISTERFYVPRLKSKNQNNVPSDVISFACTEAYSQQQQLMQSQQEPSSELQAPTTSTQNTNRYNLRARKENKKA
ncbi:uncharacterized protein LOC129905732 [Episyrphus balteatus]|uniref:uncharacterized protein LOC129905732 n=1 Tax=Episyrphus balteatus TaxID=286459 RepID=UPI002486A07A|nr:uncharacterized protein LOC129905732 [Episyrphus balteatus]